MASSGYFVEKHPSDAADFSMAFRAIATIQVPSDRFRSYFHQN